MKLPKFSKVWFFFPLGPSIAPDLQGATPTTVASESSEDEDEQLPKETQPLLVGKTVTIATTSQDDEEGELEAMSAETGSGQNVSDSDREPASDDEDDDDDDVRLHVDSHAFFLKPFCSRCDKSHQNIQNIGVFFFLY